MKHDSKVLLAVCVVCSVAACFTFYFALEYNSSIVYEVMYEHSVRVSLAPLLAALFAFCLFIAGAIYSGVMFYFKEFGGF
jgi:hypothetical protein